MGAEDEERSLATAPAGAVGPRETGTPPPPPPESVTIPSYRGIRDLVTIKDTAVLGIVCILSALIGLQLLWVPNDGFGGLVDYIGAFLWGFGLNELNKVALPTAVSQMGLPWYPATGSPGSQGPGE